VNLLAFTIYRRLRLGELRSIKIILQLTDRSTIVPISVVEDVLIMEGEFMFPINFVVLNTERVPKVESPTAHHIHLSYCCRPWRYSPL